MAITTEANKGMERFNRTGRAEADKKRHLLLLGGIYITQTALSAHFCQVQMINENGNEGPGII